MVKGDRTKYAIVAAICLMCASAAIIELSSKKEVVAVEKTDTSEETKLTDAKKSLVFGEPKIKDGEYAEGTSPQAASAVEIPKIFEETKGTAPTEVRQDGPMVIYTYDPSSDGEDAFAELRSELESEGYMMKYSIIDGNGHRSGFDLVKDGKVTQVFTDSSKDRAQLSIVEKQKD